MSTRHHANPYPPPGVIIGQSEGRGWAYIYPLPDEPSHNHREPCDLPAHYATQDQPGESP